MADLLRSQEIAAELRNESGIVLNATVGDR